MPYSIASLFRKYCILRFAYGNLCRVGVGFNVPTDTLVLPVIAHDSDAEAEPIIYGIASDTFTSLKTKTAIYPTALPFSLNNGTGELRTNASLAEFVDGFFTLDISARNSPSSNASATVKVAIAVQMSISRYLFLPSLSRMRFILSIFWGRGGRRRNICAVLESTVELVYRKFWYLKFKR